MVTVINRVAELTAALPLAGQPAGTLCAEPAGLHARAVRGARGRGVAHRAAAGRPAAPPEQHLQVDACRSCPLYTSLSPISKAVLFQMIENTVKVNLANSPIIFAVSQWLFKGRGSQAWTVS